MRKKLLRLLRLVPIALAFWGFASAQTTSTIIGVVTDASTGKPVAGALVVATSAALQGEQTALSDEAGNYRLTLLPAGDYKLVVQLQGYKPYERSDITLRLDKTLRANLTVVPEAVQLEEQVVRTGVAPVVNVGSAESATVLTREFIASVPVGRSLEAIATTVPTANTNDPFGTGFAGAQSPENQYVVDGLNTTDPVFGTRSGDTTGGVGATPALLSNFYDQVDVKTSGFDAEYGRATGAMLNVGLKSGSNEFHGEVFSTYTPRSWVEPDGRVAGVDGEAIAYRTKPDQGAYNLDFGFQLGGPIMRDKLWFLAGFAPIYAKTVYQRYQRINDPGGGQTTIPGSELNVAQTRSSYQWVGKLTYLIDENNSVTVSGWGVPTTTENLLINGFVGGPMNSTASARTIDQDNGLFTVFGKYGGKFLDKRLIVEAQVGYYSATETPKPKTIDGTDQFTTPRMEWGTGAGPQYRNLTDFEAAPGCTSVADCPVLAYATGGSGFNADTTTTRLAGKISGAYLFSAGGQHNVKAGIDLERNEYEIKKTYTGGWYYLENGAQIRAFRGYGYIADPTGLTNDPNLVVQLPFVENKSGTNSFAYFLQDSYRPIPDLTVNLGLRLETQKMENLTTVQANGFSIQDSWSPRIGAIWDFTGQGRGKVAGSWGRFYYAMPLDMGDRAFGVETQVQWRGTLANCPNFPASTANGGAAGWDTKNASYSSCLPLIQAFSGNAFRQIGASEPTPVDPTLKGAYVDKYGAQAEYEVIQDLSFGVEWLASRQTRVIEDMSSDDGGHYYIGNPGEDKSIPNPDPTNPNPVSSRYVDTVDPQTGRTVSVVFPKPERSYDGFTFKVVKNLSKNWLAQASYTYSVLRGNYSGPYYPEYNQLDPGITAEYDLASLMANKKGLLPGDQTHSVKLFGAYTWPISPTFNVTGSAAYNGISGTPVNVLGAHPDYGTGSTNIIPKGQGGRGVFTSRVDLGAGAEYVISPPYAIRFRVDLFNVFNAQDPILYDNDYTFDTVAPISGISCKGDYAGGSDPVGAVQGGCPALRYLKTVEGFPATPNPNWGKPGRTTVSFQAPLSLRLGLSLTF